ncbi:MAG: pyridoxamine 5'-phosphate oxidase family protein [Hyphomicrobiaceae bacterium]
MPVADIEHGSPWHSGEIALQETIGSAERLRVVGLRVMRDHMPDQHRAFFAQLPFAILGSVDKAGAPWATIVTGMPGFLKSPDPRTLSIGLRTDASDPVAEGLAAGQAIGLLGIELSTRRRNRVNGLITTSNNDGLTIAVEQSFGNCPQYIRLRDFAVADGSQQCSGNLEEFKTLDGRPRQIVENADTFFVATYADLPGGRRQVDASHRGGRIGFVRIANDGTLTIPDYSGNRFFNTLGNIVVSGRAGMLFIDFVNGDVLQLSGTAEVLLDNPDLPSFTGAERLWRVTPTRLFLRRRAVALSWTDRT